jgi:hypothetical protein
MSASTIRTRVTPSEALTREVMARRQDMLAERAARVERSVAERRCEYERRGAIEAGALAELAARCDSLRSVPERQLEEAREAIASAATEDRSLSAAAERVTQLERVDDGAWTSRVRRELVLEELATRCAARIEPGRASWQADGSLVASLRFTSGHEVPISMPGGGADPQEQVTWHTAASSVEGCDAQRDFVEWVSRSSGLEMEVEDQLEGEAAEFGHTAEGAL